MRKKRRAGPKVKSQLLMLLRQQMVRPMRAVREGAVAVVAEIDRTGTGKMVNL